MLQVCSPAQKCPSRLPWVESNLSICSTGSCLCVVTDPSALLESFSENSSFKYLLVDFPVVPSLMSISESSEKDFLWGLLSFSICFLSISFTLFDIQLFHIDISALVCVVSCIILLSFIKLSKSHFLRLCKAFKQSPFRQVGPLSGHLGEAAKLWRRPRMWRRRRALSKWTGTWSNPGVTMTTGQCWGLRFITPPALFCSGQTCLFADPSVVDLTRQTRQDRLRGRCQRSGCYSQRHRLAQRRGERVIKHLWPANRTPPPAAW